MHFLEMIKAFQMLAWCTFTPRILQAAQSKHTLPAYTSHLQDCCNICQTAHQLPTFYAKRPSLTHVTHLYKKKHVYPGNPVSFATKTNCPNYSKLCYYGTSKLCYCGKERTERLWPSIFQPLIFHI